MLANSPMSKICTFRDLHITFEINLLSAINFGVFKNLFFAIQSIFHSNDSFT